MNGCLSLLALPLPATHRAQSSLSATPRCTTLCTKRGTAWASATPTCTSERPWVECRWAALYAASLCKRSIHLQTLEWPSDMIPPPSFSCAPRRLEGAPTAPANPLGPGATTVNGYSDPLDIMACCKGDYGLYYRTMAGGHMCSWTGVGRAYDAQLARLLCARVFGSAMMQPADLALALWGASLQAGCGAAPLSVLCCCPLTWRHPARSASPSGPLTGTLAAALGGCLLTTQAAEHVARQCTWLVACIIVQLAAMRRTE